uniref:Uncharacterized protein n=1 Tax=Manihot esculenta TaxID=3983 RepID=A0A2C9VUC3_MANES
MAISSTMTRSAPYAQLKIEVVIIVEFVDYGDWCALCQLRMLCYFLFALISFMFSSPTFVYFASSLFMKLGFCEFVAIWMYHRG